MKKTIIAIVLGLGVLSSTAGCAAWFNELKNNPALVVQEFDAVVQTVLSDISVAWTFAQPLIPASALPAVTTAYQTGLVSINHAEAALNAAVQAASDAQQPSPNFTALMADVSVALTQVITIVDQYGGHVVAPGALGASTAVPGLADAHAGISSLSRWTH